MLATCSLDQLRGILEAIGAPAFVVEVQDGGGVCYAAINRRLAEAAGLDPAHIAGRPPHELLPPEHAEAVAAGVRRCLDLRSQTECETERGHPDGTRRMRSSLVPLFDATGRVCRILGIETEITGRTLARRRAEAQTLLFDAMPDSAPVGITMEDAEARLLRVNRAWLDMFGYAEEEVLGQPFTLILPAAERAAALERFHAVLGGGGGGGGGGGESRPTGERVAVTRSGERRNILLGLARVLDEEGRPFVVATHVDITERKRAEEALRDREAKLRAIVDNAADAILIIDGSGTVRTFNPAAERIFGYAADEIVGRTITLLMPEPHRSEHDGYMRAYLETGRARIIGSSREVEGRRKDGSAVPLDLSVADLRVAGEHLFLGICRDITRRKTIEAELDLYRLHLEDLVEERAAQVAEMQRRFTAAVDASPDAIVIIDEAGRLSFVSDRFRSYFSAIGDRLREGLRVEQFVRLLGSAQRGPGDFAESELGRWWQQPSGMIEARLSDGRWVRLSAERVPGGGVAVVQTDVTAYKQQETVLIAQADLLERALDRERDLNALHGRALSMTSHEFRTPLTIIDLQAQRLERRAARLDAAEITRRAAKIRGAVARMIALVDTWLSAARLDAGRIEPEPVPCDLAALVAEIGHRQQEIAPSHRIAVDIVGLPPVRGDRTLLDQVFSNLLANAVKYAPGDPRIEVTGRTEGGMAVVAVRDHGVGIPANEMPRLFQRFFRARTAAGIPGTGIGLDVVRQLVEMHGGSVAAESREGEGSTFTVRLPADRPAAPAEEPPPGGRTGGTARTGG